VRAGEQIGECYRKETCYIGFCTLRCTIMEFKEKNISHVIEKPAGNH